METIKKKKPLYWIAKGLISFFIFFGAYHSYAHPEDFKTLGFPDYFRVELISAELLGAILLLVPQISLRVKEWIYTGYCISVISGFIAQISCHAPISKAIFIAIIFTIMVICIRYVSKQERISNMIVVN